MEMLVLTGKTPPAVAKMLFGPKPKSLKQVATSEASDVIGSKPLKVWQTKSNNHWLYINGCRMDADDGLLPQAKDKDGREDK